MMMMMDKENAVAERPAATAVVAAGGDKTGLQEEQQQQQRGGLREVVQQQQQEEEEEEEEEETLEVLAYVYVLKKEGTLGPALSLYDAPCLIGRSKDADLRVRHSEVSRRHALLEWQQSAPVKGERGGVHYMVFRHLSNANSSRINGQPITAESAPVVLRSGDEISILHRQFKFEYAPGKDPFDNPDMDEATITATVAAAAAAAGAPEEKQQRQQQNDNEEYHTINVSQLLQRVNSSMAQHPPPPPPRPVTAHPGVAEAVCAHVDRKIARAKLPAQLLQQIAERRKSVRKIIASTVATQAMAASVAEEPTTDPAAESSENTIARRLSTPVRKEIQARFRPSPGPAQRVPLPASERISASPARIPVPEQPHRKALDTPTRAAIRARVRGPAHGPGSAANPATYEQQPEHEIADEGEEDNAKQDTPIPGPSTSTGGLLRRSATTPGMRMHHPASPAGRGGRGLRRRSFTNLAALGHLPPVVEEHGTEDDDSMAEDDSELAQDQQRGAGRFRMGALGSLGGPLRAMRQSLESTARDDVQEEPEPQQPQQQLSRPALPTPVRRAIIAHEGLRRCVEATGNPVRPRSQPTTVRGVVASMMREAEQQQQAHGEAGGEPRRGLPTPVRKAIQRRRKSRGSLASSDDTEAAAAAAAATVAVASAAVCTSADGSIEARKEEEEADEEEPGIVSPMAATADEADLSANANESGDAMEPLRRALATPIRTAINNRRLSYSVAADAEDDEPEAAERSFQNNSRRVSFPADLLADPSSELQEHETGQEDEEPADFHPRSLPTPMRLAIAMRRKSFSARQQESEQEPQEDTKAAAADSSRTLPAALVAAIVKRRKSLAAQHQPEKRNDEEDEKAGGDNEVEPAREPLPAAMLAAIAKRRQSSSMPMATPAAIEVSRDVSDDTEGGDVSNKDDDAQQIVVRSGNAKQQHNALRGVKFFVRSAAASKQLRAAVAMFKSSESASSSINSGRFARLAPVAYAPALGPLRRAGFRQRTHGARGLLQRSVPHNNGSASSATSAIMARLPSQPSAMRPQIASLRSGYRAAKARPHARSYRNAQMGFAAHTKLTATTHMAAVEGFAMELATQLGGNKDVSYGCALNAYLTDTADFMKHFDPSNQRLAEALSLTEDEVVEEPDEDAEQQNQQEQEQEQQNQQEQEQEQEHESQEQQLQRGGALHKHAVDIYAEEMDEHLGNACLAYGYALDAYTADPEAFVVRVLGSRFVDEWDAAQLRAVQVYAREMTPYVGDACLAYGYALDAFQADPEEFLVRVLGPNYSVAAALSSEQRTAQVSEQATSWDPTHLEAVEAYADEMTPYLGGDACTAYGYALDAYEYDPESFVQHVLYGAPEDGQWEATVEDAVDRCAIDAYASVVDDCIGDGETALAHAIEAFAAAPDDFVARVSGVATPRVEEVKDGEEHFMGDMSEENQKDEGEQRMDIDPALCSPIAENAQQQQQAQQDQPSSVRRVQIALPTPLRRDINARRRRSSAVGDLAREAGTVLSSAAEEVVQNLANKMRRVSGVQETLAAGLALDAFAAGAELCREQLRASGIMPVVVDEDEAAARDACEDVRDFASEPTSTYATDEAAAVEEQTGEWLGQEVGEALQRMFSDVAEDITCSIHDLADAEQHIEAVAREHRMSIQQAADEEEEAEEADGADEEAEVEAETETETMPSPTAAAASAADESMDVVRPSVEEGAEEQVEFASSSEVAEKELDRSLNLAVAVEAYMAISEPVCLSTSDGEDAQDAEQSADPVPVSLGSKRARDGSPAPAPAVDADAECDINTEEEDEGEAEEEPETETPAPKRARRSTRPSRRPSSAASSFESEEDSTPSRSTRRTSRRKRSVADRQEEDQDQDQDQSVPATGLQEAGDAKTSSAQEQELEADNDGDEEPVTQRPRLVATLDAIPEEPEESVDVDDDAATEVGESAAEMEPDTPQAEASEVAELEQQQEGCKICGNDDNWDSILLCDGCDGEFHMKCVRVRRVPKNDWFCPDCKERRKREAAEKRAAARAAKAAAEKEKAAQRAAARAAKAAEKKAAEDAAAAVAQEEEEAVEIAAAAPARATRRRARATGSSAAPASSTRSTRATRASRRSTLAAADSEPEFAQELGQEEGEAEEEVEEEEEEEQEDEAPKTRRGRRSTRASRSTPASEVPPARRSTRRSSRR